VVAADIGVAHASAEHDCAQKPGKEDCILRGKCIHD